MPDLNFHVVGVEAAKRGLLPLLQFQVKVCNQPESEVIHSVMLHAQIQIQAPQRGYNDVEKEKLVELFGSPDRWGQTLRNRLWGSTDTTVPAFSGTTQAVLSMPCTFDLNIAAAKYFYALDGGDVSLLFLFSGTVFFQGADGRLQVQRISWNKECVLRMPVQLWKDLMTEHFPNAAWLYLDRNLFDRLAAYKRSRGFTNWDEVIASLLECATEPEATV